MPPLSMASSNGHVNFIWSIAIRLRGSFKQHEYGSIILPFTLLRRLDQVLAPTKDHVLTEAAKYEGRGLSIDPILKTAAGQLFYNASKLSLEKVKADPDHAASHLRQYLAGFDPVVREIFEAFEFDATIGRLEKAERLYPLLGLFLDPELDLHPDSVPNEVMGNIFEELIRRFSEISNETAGEHFTPREVVELCTELALVGDDDVVATPGAIRSVYDPACGTGGMLSMCEERVRARNEHARVVSFGQELNPESWAICRAEMLVKGQDPSRIAAGSTLSADGASGKRFDYMLANPPFGVDWSDDHDAVTTERDNEGLNGRFGAGTPRTNDGALLFLQHMLAKAKPAGIDNGSRIAIVFNASPLFSGDAGSGTSNIRRWVAENDWLEAIVALPEELFYNTGIGTYIWVLTTNKAPERRGKVQVIDARHLWESMPESFGEKRRRLNRGHIDEIISLWKAYEPDGPHSKVRLSGSFGYRKVIIEQPLRVSYEAGPQAAKRLASTKAFQTFQAGASGSTAELILARIADLPSERHTDGSLAEKRVAEVTKAERKVGKSVRDAVRAALCVRDESAPIVTTESGGPVADPELRDTENVPLLEDVLDFVGREVQRELPDAWWDGDSGKIGYEFPVKGLFFRPKEPRPLLEIDSEVESLEQRLHAFLEERL